MIVIDNFIQDEVLLAAIENDKDFFGPNGNYTWWDGWFNSPANTTKKQLIQYIWKDNCPLSYSIGLNGFEYWTGVYGPNEGVQELGTHFDKDELHWERTGGSEGGEVLRPEIGTVYYPKDVPFTGGYLEIEHPDGVMERIQAKYNRLIIFDAGTCLHRVTPVESGTRYAIAINLWDHIPVAAQEGSMNIE
jgi:hypothetical protein|tara:strand:+ start:8155 stop:8724 length:570 start_codon:yes stop_codon:yes gene_type:complete